MAQGSDNRLNVSFYDRYTRDVRYSLQNLASSAMNIRFSTGYPRGLYLDASMELPLKYGAFPDDRPLGVAIRNGMTTIYDGEIQNIEIMSEAPTRAMITMSGAWGAYLSRRVRQIMWADNRMMRNIWVWDESLSAAENTSLDRFNRLRITPKGTQIASAAYSGVTYTMPENRTIKRITFNYDLQESSYAFQIRLRDSIGVSTLWFLNSSGTGSVNHTLVTPRNYLHLQFYSEATQTPPNDGTVYGQFTNIMVYEYTGSINPTEVIKDIADLYGTVSLEDHQIGSNVYGLAPFYSLSPERITDILTRAVSYGDASFNPWAIQILSTDESFAKDGKVLLAFAQYPDLTDFDYIVSLADNNVSPTTITRGFDETYNQIGYSYINSVTGAIEHVTWNDDSSLRDQDSIDKWGQYDYHLNLSGISDSTTAKNVAKRFLEEHKEPSYRMASPLLVRGHIRDKFGANVPVCRVRAGKRIKVVENVMPFQFIAADTSPVFLITQTDYDEYNESVSIQAGTPSGLDVILARANEGHGNKVGLEGIPPSVPITRSGTLF